MAGRQPGKESPESGLGGAASSMRKAQPYIDASWQFIGAVALCTLAGYWADKKFGTKPWLLLVGAVLGFAAGLTSFLRVIAVLSRNERREAEQGKTPHDTTRDEKQ